MSPPTRPRSFALRLLCPLILLLSLGAGCAGPEITNVPDPTARDLLVAAPRRFAVLPAESAVSLVAHVAREDRWDDYQTSLTLRSGALTLAADAEGGVRLLAATLTFEDVIAGDPAAPSDGLHITHIQATTWTEHECESVDWSPDGDACAASISPVFHLDWALVAASGDVYPLASQELPPIGLGLSLDRDDQGLTAAAVGGAPGALWSWSGMVEFSDLVLDLAAREVIDDPEVM